MEREVNRVAGVALAVVAVLFGLTLWEHGRASRAHDARVAAEATANQLGQIADSIAKVERVRDRVRVVTRERWDTVVQRVTNRPDSGAIDPDTAQRGLTDLIAAGTEAIAACEAVVSTCQARAAALFAANDSLRSALTSAKREVRGRRLFGLVPLPEVVAGYGVTASGDGRVSHGPAIVAGWRIF